MLLPDGGGVCSVRFVAFLPMSNFTIKNGAPKINGSIQPNIRMAALIAMPSFITFPAAMMQRGRISVETWDNCEAIAE